jgi:hypothetical protein
MMAARRANNSGSEAIRPTMVTTVMNRDGQALKTGQPRALQIDQAIARIDFAQGAIGPVAPLVEETKPVLRERLLVAFNCSVSGK